jgi:glutathione S-transferase
VDGDITLYESFAITQYLAAKYGADTGLAPKTVEETAISNQ